MVDLDKTKTIDGFAYWIENEENGVCHIPLNLCKKIMKLLKELEPIAPVPVNRYMEIDENGNWFLSETYDCGDCGGELHSKANYCHLCGRRVKWE